MNESNLCRICLCLEDDKTKHLSIFESKEKTEIALKMFLISGVQVCTKYFVNIKQIVWIFFTVLKYYLFRSSSVQTFRL